MELLQLVSIALEALITVLLVLAARKRSYLLGLAVTFGIYVIYDLSKLYAWDIDPLILSLGFLVATLTALYSVVRIVRA